MLHKLELPAYRLQLEAILDFQYLLLSFACTTPLPVLPLIPKMLKDRFGEQRGGWLSERCWKDKKGKKINTFGKELENLASYVTLNPSEGPVIVDAFKHDRTFYLHLNDANFEFQYAKLSPKAKEAVKPLMVSFYEKLLFTGFPSYIHLYNNEPFTYKLLLKGFYDANPRLKVCPGCDGPPPSIKNQIWNVEIIDDEEYQNEAEVDHFFPKAFYPFLSIHFMNLVPLCPICNTKAKNDKDPLNGYMGKGVLQYTFMPFSKPAAQSIEVTVAKNANSLSKVVIKSKPGLATAEQIENLNRTFKLTPRWEHHLRSWIGDTMLEIGVLQARRKSSRQGIEKEIKKRLRPFANAREESIGQMTHLLVQRGYANYALNEQREIDLLIEQAMDNNVPKRMR
jgi:hypothetical protein